MLIKAKKAVIVHEENGQPRPEIVQNVVIKINDRKIEEILTEMPNDVSQYEVIESDLVTPGFVDIHNHGNFQLQFFFNTSKALEEVTNSFRLGFYTT